MKAAILVASEQPLVIDDIALSDHLEFGQVLVDVHYSGICGAQINEIDAVKGPDKHSQRSWIGCVYCERRRSCCIALAS